tara:strand:- start:1686 stop:1973 length:288 start_codon:yes stop_codon:yes gene_type:complete
MSGAYTPYAKYAIIEYRLHWCDEEGVACDIEFVEGKHWRYVRKMVEECKAGLHDDFDNSKLRYGWIERVERWMDQRGEYCEDDDYETLWEREVEE